MHPKTNSMKKIIFILAIGFMLVGCANLNKKESTLIQDCPESKIINRMPQIIDENNSDTKQLPNEYYIYKGERREISEFDAKWVEENCEVPEEIVY